MAGFVPLAVGMTGDVNLNNLERELPEGSVFTTSQRAKVSFEMGGNLICERNPMKENTVRRF